MADEKSEKQRDGILSVWTIGDVIKVRYVMAGQEKFLEISLPELYHLEGEKNLLRENLGCPSGRCPT